MNILLLGGIWFCIAVSCLWFAADGGQNDN